MKIKKRIGNGMMILLAVVTLLAGTIHSEEVTGASAVTSLDTRSYTEDWSSEVRLYTKKIVGTVILVY